MTSANSMHEAGHLKLLLQRDGIQREEGGVSGLWDRCTPMADSC